MFKLLFNLLFFAAVNQNVRRLELQNTGLNLDTYYQNVSISMNIKSDLSLKVNCKKSRRILWNIILIGR
jgi:hypothetical protein